MSHRNLNEILQSVQTAHRKDILDFAGGHLNESKLYKPPSSWTYQGWGSGQEDDIVMKQKSKIPRPKKGAVKRNEMKETLLEFSTGTAGTLLHKPPVNVTVPGEKKSIQPSTYDDVRDSHHIEELSIGDMMLPKSRYYRSKAWNEQDLDPDEISKPVQTQGDLRSKNLASKVKHQFVPVPVGGITKADQFRLHKKVENDIVRKSDANETKVLYGCKAVEHLEAKLKSNLEELELGGYGPNFNRLQIYVDVFDDLIQESQTFGHILKTIQDEYSNYIDCLVDNHPSQHRLLRDQVDNLTLKGLSQPAELAKEKKKVRDLEAEGKKLLNINEKLRKEIDIEEKLAAELEAPKQTSALSYQEHDIVALSLEEKVEDLRASVLGKMDEIRNIKKKLNAEYVPATVCVQLEGCVKDTETENQKLLKHNEIMSSDIATLEKELGECIEVVDGDEEDEERVWRKINGDPNDDGYLSPRSESDEGRWGFYIS